MTSPAVETRTGVRHTPKRVLMLVANTEQLHGMDVGFFAEEMTRPFLEFTEAGYTIDLRSPRGGAVMFDSHSDPRTPNGPYVNDLISLGFVHHEGFGQLLQKTPSIDGIQAADYDAVWVTGGGAPLIAFKDDTALHDLISDFVTSGKVTALVCHGTSLLLWARGKDGGLIADGKAWTGFADSEEREINQQFGMTVNDWTIESEAKKNSNTRFVREEADTPFAVRDGNLITGQQQYSSALAAEMVIEALDETT